MQKVYYDLHIHTCLSPCGDVDSTPNNVVNMAKIKGLDVIAITDHNTMGNVEACIKVGEKVGLTVIP
ncbi:MAG: PHP domain-containing protein, partial [Clostridia bacterium]|nr:PHP domain-containing protein [Clostridia bacterium]